MAYTIPVAALVFDNQAAAAVINKPADYFENDGYDRWDGVQDLQQLTGSPVTEFSSEDQSVFYIGIDIEEDWCIEINNALLAKAAALKAQYQHPLVQSATLAVVSQFC